MVLQVDTCMYPTVFDQCHINDQYDYLEFWNHWSHMCLTADGKFHYLLSYNIMLFMKYAPYVEFFGRLLVTTNVAGNPTIFMVGITSFLLVCFYYLR